MGGSFRKPAAFGMMNDAFFILYNIINLSQQLQHHHYNFYTSKMK